MKRLPFGSLLCFHFGWGALGIWIGLCAGLILIGLALLRTWHKRLHSETCRGLEANVK